MNLERIWAELAEERRAATQYAETNYTSSTERLAAETIFRIGWDAHGEERFASADEAALEYAGRYWLEAKYEEDLGPVKRDFVAGWKARVDYLNEKAKGIGHAA